MSLFNNAISSIQIGVEDAQSADSGRVISGLRSLHAGILLLIKEVLVRLSPPDSKEVLIRSRVLPVRTSDGGIAFVGNGRKTVDIPEMTERCKSLGISVDWARIEEITRIRNDAEHYFTTLSVGAIQSALAKSFVVIRELLDTHLGEEPMIALGQQTWQHLLKNAEVYDRERQECLTELNAIDWKSDALAEAVEAATCDACGSDLLAPNGVASKLEDLALKCRSCGEVQAFTDFAPAALRASYRLQAYRIMKDGGDDEMIDCPHCGEFGYVMAEQRCAICGESAEHECSRCGCRIPASEVSDSEMCGYCEHMWEKLRDE